MAFFFFIGIFILAALVVCLYTWIFQLLWGALVPIVFPGAVEQGLIADHLTFWTALLVVVMIRLLIGPDSIVKVKSRKG